MVSSDCEAIMRNLNEQVAGLPPPQWSNPKINGELEQAGYRLLATGLDDRFHETNSSAGTGFGTVTGYQDWFHMMDAPPYPRTNRAVSADETLSGQITDP